ncbi:uncharacterized protein VTP21DRAFT_8980 [Calcarisporiella thermophila]|uniref:uncharacterized protein n=1 Tax=Calcarisporiella thermophila TaxID=911321 RepID=UPI0037436EE4
MNVTSVFDQKTKQATLEVISKQDAESTGASNVRRFFADKDWKFYTAVALAVVVAGTGIWYLASPSSASENQAGKKKSRKKKTPSSGDKEPGEKRTPGEEEQDILTLPKEQITKLSEKERKTAAQTLKTRGNAKFGAKQYSEAITFYSKAIEFHPDPVYYGNRAACYANLEEHDNVIADCNEALRMDPSYVKALNRRAQAYEKSGQSEKALHDFTAACILDGFKNQTASTSMERMLKQVVEEKTKAIMATKKPRLPSKTFISTYFDSFRKEPDEEAEEPADKESGDAYYYRAKSLLREKKYEQSMEACMKAVELGCSRMVNAMQLKATFLMLKGDVKGALETLRETVKLDPTYTKSYIQMASIYMEQSDPVSAFQQLDEAFKINPNDPDVHFHRGQQHFIAGDLTAAADAYSKSIELHNDFPYAHIQFAVAQYKLGNVEKALSLFEKMKKQFPESLEVHNYYGELLLDQQNFDAAIEMFDKAHQLDPTHAIPYVNKALLAAQRDHNLAEAEKLCRKALQVDPDSDAALATLTQILLQQGKQAEANECIERSIELARTEAELSNAISYREAARAQETFLRNYPQHAERLAALSLQQ